MKKWFCVLVVAITFVLMCGCGSNKTDSTSDIVRVKEFYADEGMKNPYSESDIETIKANMVAEMEHYVSPQDIGECYISNGCVFMQGRYNSVWYMYKGLIENEGMDELPRLSVTNVERYELFE